MSNVRLYDFLPIKDDRDVDIVFIHGLNGHPFDTWGHSAERPTWVTGWGGEIMRVCPNANVFSIGYDAAAFALPFNRKLTIRESAANARLTLVNHGLGEKPIIFVCHSMGGLLLKQILRKDDVSSSSGGKLLNSISHVMFIGTPHKGSRLASILKYLLWPFVSKNVNFLAHYSEYLDDLHEWYAAKCTLRFKTANFFEKRRSYFLFDVVGIEGLDFISSGVESHELYESHISICKANSDSTTVVDTLCKFISEVVEAKSRNDNQSPVLGKIKSKYSFIYHAIDGARSSSQVRDVIEFIERCRVGANTEQLEALDRARAKISLVTQQAFQEDPNIVKVFRSPERSISAR